jgi:hypothetical protein
MQALLLRLTPVICALPIALTLFLALALPSADVRLSVAAAALAVLAIVVSASAVVTPHTIVIGARATAHREPMSRLAEPSHPTTAGKPRSRAPGVWVQAA